MLCLSVSKGISLFVFAFEHSHSHACAAVYSLGATVASTMIVGVSLKASAVKFVVYLYVRHYGQCHVRTELPSFCRSPLLSIQVQYSCVGAAVCLMQ